MKIPEHMRLRPTAWLAIAVGLCHFAITLLESQYFFGVSEYSMFWRETFPAILWFPVSEFVDPNDITVPMQYFPLLGAWLSLLALSALSTAWGLYAYFIGRMVTSSVKTNRYLMVAFGIYALLVVAVWVLPFASPAILMVLGLAGVLGSIGSIIATAVSRKRAVWPGVVFFSANMLTCAYFSFVGWVYCQL